MCALNLIESVVGREKLKDLFEVIFTDRGFGFCDFEAIERGAYGPQRRCLVFCCNPMCFRRKGSCEKREFIRRILPTGCDLDALSRHDIAIVASHVNGYPRPSLSGRSPPVAVSREVLERRK